MEMIGKVRRMKLRDKLSHSAIAKVTGLSRTTVKKWLNVSAPIEYWPPVPIEVWPGANAGSLNANCG